MAIERKGRFCTGACELAPGILAATGGRLLGPLSHNSNWPQAT